MKIAALLILIANSVPSCAFIGLPNARPAFHHLRLDAKRNLRHAGTSFRTRAPRGLQAGTTLRACDIRCEIGIGSPKSCVPPPTVLLRSVKAIIDELGGLQEPAFRVRASVKAPAPPDWLDDECGEYLLRMDAATLTRAEALGLRSLLRFDTSAPHTLRRLAASLDALEELMLPLSQPPASTPSCRTPNENTERAASIQWDSTFEQLLAYFEASRRSLPPDWASSPQLLRKATQPPAKGTALRAWVDEQRRLAAGILPAAGVHCLFKSTSSHGLK